MNPVANKLGPVMVRFGETVPVKRFQKSGKDRLNHETGSWQLVGNVECLKYHPDENEQVALASGNRDTDRPNLVFEKAADIEDGDRVFFPSVTYEIQSMTITHGYQLATVKKTD